MHLFNKQMSPERRECWQFFFFFSPSLLPLPLYSGHSVWWFLQRGGSDCRSSAGGDSSVWNFIFSIASDHFTPDNVQSFFLCVINVPPPKKKNLNLACRVCDTGAQWFGCTTEWQRVAEQIKKWEWQWFTFKSFPTISNVLPLKLWNTLLMLLRVFSLTGMDDCSFLLL